MGKETDPYEVCVIVLLFRELLLFSLLILGIASGGPSVRSKRIADMMDALESSGLFILYVL